MGQNCDPGGYRARLARLGMVGLAVVLFGFAESPAEAGFLKNGARPGKDRVQTIKPPRKGARNRILTPAEREEAAKPKPKVKKNTGKRRRQDYAWFWKLYSPGLLRASSARWGQAIQTMKDRRARGQGITSRSTVGSIEIAYRRQIRAAALRHKVSEALITAVITVESRGQPKAVSHAGAQGLMQLMPATARRFGVSDSFNTAQNINAGAAYLSWLLNEFRGDPLLALAGYNAGEGAVRKHRGVPPFSETRDYVVKVMDAVALIESRCKTAPATPRARCDYRDGLG